MSKSYMDNVAFARAGVKIVIHPDKPGKFAKILTAYPRDGAGKLTVYIHDFFGDYGSDVQTGTASGYGYDKFTAAIQGLHIDGIEMTDHCATNAESAAWLQAYINAESKERVVRDANSAGYLFANGNESCYRMSGLDILTAIGYQIIGAI